MSEKSGGAAPQVIKSGESGESSGRPRHNRRGNKTRTNLSTYQNKFEGREPDLKGHVYDLTDDKTPELYINTTKEIITFVGRKYKDYNMEIVQGLEKLKLDDPQPPTDPDPNDKVQFEKWKSALNDYNNRLKAFQNFRSGLYSLVFGQCSDALQDKLKSHRDFEASRQDGIKLLIIIKSLTHTVEEQLYLPDATASVIKDFYTLRQRKFESLQAYHQRYLAQVQVLQEMGIRLVPSTIVDYVADKNGHQGIVLAADRTEANELYLATCFLQSVNQNYSSYLDHLRDSFLDGQEVYPSTLHQAYNILQRRSVSINQPHLTGGDGVAFTQSSGARNVTCFRCQEQGHYANDCPTRREQQQKQQLGSSSFMTGTEHPTSADGRGGSFMFSQVASDIPSTWILLDNQSTIIKEIFL
jgi:hypothetical protein